MCWQHYQSRHHLKLAPSRIANAGLGLYTTRAIQRYKKIANYTGKMMTDDEWTADPSDYAVQWDDNKVLDARSTQDAIGRYANECRAPDRRAGRCRGNNALLRHTRNNTAIVESRGARIPAGSEILLPYGRRYWEGALKKIKRSKSIEY
jgi:hypothetical protein